MGNLEGMNDFSTNAKLALVIVEPAKCDASNMEPQREWKEFLYKIQERTTPTKTTTKIHENIWLIPLSDGLPFLMDLFLIAKSFHIPLRILFLDSEPDWLKYPPDPVSMEV